VQEHWHFPIAAEFLLYNIDSVTRRCRACELSSNLVYGGFEAGD
jgi:hypothetical protein